MGLLIVFACILVIPGRGFTFHQHERVQVIPFLGHSSHVPHQTKLFASGRGQKARKEAKLAKSLDGSEKTTPTNTPEFSRPMSLQQISRLRVVNFDPKPDEVEGLCQRLNLEGLQAMRVSLESSMSGIKGCVKVIGDVEAVVVQRCAISNTNFTSIVEAEFECTLVQAGDKGSAALLAEDGDVDVEEVPSSGIVDLAEVAVQYLSLELDSYPVAPGVTFEMPQMPL